MPRFSGYFRIEVGVRVAPVEADTAEQAEKMMLDAVNFDTDLGLNRDFGFANPMVVHTQYGDDIQGAVIDILDDDDCYVTDETYPIIRNYSTDPLPA